MLNLPSYRFLRYVRRLSLSADVIAQGLDGNSVSGIAPSSSPVLPWSYHNSRHPSRRRHPGAWRRVLSRTDLVRQGVGLLFLVFQMSWIGRLGSHR